MATNSGLNFSDSSTLDVAQYSRVGITAFREQSFWRAAINPRYIKTVENGFAGRKVDWSTMSGTSLADITSNVLAASAPTIAAKEAIISQYGYAVPISNFAQSNGSMDIFSAAMLDAGKVIAEGYDLYAATKAITGSQVEYVGQSAEASITASNVMTKALVTKAHNKLSRQKAPKFATPWGPLYLAFIHPDVSYDLFTESSGILTAATNVEGEAWVSGVIGKALGFLFIETANSALLSADAGAGAVDVYMNVFVADESLGAAHGVIEPLTVAGGIEIPVFEDRSAVVRVVPQSTNLGLDTHIGPVGRFGFAILNEYGLYRIESAASLGSNT